ncbi:hypothetical protein NC652_022474 [Populus alba x Populus x berolinensis]|nr:hypothetical protein NC652_022474 [Populus alba x Populus x berolinensis]
MNLGARPEDLPTLVPAKHGHVSSVGPSKTMTNVKPVLCPPPGFYIVATTITGTWEVNRRRKKVKLSRDAIIDLPCPAILQLPLGLISLDIGSLVLPLV